MSHKKTVQQEKYRPFLKWAGGKFRLTDTINKALPKGKSCLIEPFVGAGAVFLNSDFERYILFDINPDLIGLFNIVKQDVENYIRTARALFLHTEANTEYFYYIQRTAFNASKDPFERAVLFLYLNRFGYNGLCRYNLKGEFNVPFGRFKKTYFPEKELRQFAEKAQRAEFICGDFQEAFQYADENSVIYCDPPYAPLEQASNFTGYAGNIFDLEKQSLLASLAKDVSYTKSIPVVISNHDTPFTRDIYTGAKIKSLKVQRFISRSTTTRLKVKELIAIFKASS